MTTPNKQIEENSLQNGIEISCKANRKLWWILILNTLLCGLTTYSIIVYKFSLPECSQPTKDSKSSAQLPNTIINFNNSSQKIEQTDFIQKKTESNDLANRIANIENRYSTLVSEIGIWITFLVGIITIITLIIGYIFQDKAKEQYIEISLQLDDTNKQLKHFKKKFENEFLLKEKFYHSCLSLQAIYMNTNFTTPLIKSMVSNMLCSLSEISKLCTSDETNSNDISNDWISRSDEFLMLHKTLNYIFPILRSKNEIIENVYQIQALQDKLCRLLFLQGKLKAILPLSEKDETLSEKEQFEKKKLIEEIKELINIIFNQTKILATALHREANNDINGDIQ